MTLNTSHPLDHQPVEHQPMSAGNIIGAGWRFYTSNFVSNCIITLQGLLWSVAPVALALAAAALFVQQALGDIDTIDAAAIEPYLGVLVLATVGLAVFSLYCFAQSLGYFLGISRLAFQSFSGEHESKQAALRFTRSRKFAMLKAALLQSLIIFAAYFVIAIALALLAVVAARLFNVDAASAPNLPLYLLIGLLGALSIILAACTLVWLVVRLMLTQQPLATEPQSGAARAVARSWQITRKNVGRTLLVTLLCVLISLPISIVTYMVSNTVVLSIFGVAATVPGESPQSLLTFIVATLVSLLISLLGSIITTPFWYATLAALYFDSRNRLNQSVAKQARVPVSSNSI